MAQPKTDLAYFRSEKAKAEQKLRSCQHREKILERRMSELNRRERLHPSEKGILHAGHVPRSVTGRAG